MNTRVTRFLLPISALLLLSGCATSGEPILSAAKIEAMIHVKVVKIAPPQPEEPVAVATVN